MSDQTAEEDISAVPGTVLNAQVSYLLEFFHEGVWQGCTAHKTDPEELLRTLDFREANNPEDRHRIVRVDVMAAVVSREDVAKLVPPKEETVT